MSPVCSTSARYPIRRSGSESGILGPGDTRRRGQLAGRITLLALSLAGCILDDGGRPDDGGSPAAPLDAAPLDGPRTDGDELQPVGSPRLVVEPPRFAFPAIAVGDSADREVAIRNVGSADAEIATIDWLVAGDREFQLFFVRARDNQQYEAISRDGDDQLAANGAYPLVVPPDEALRLVLNYQPVDDQADVGGRIVVRANTPEDVQIPIIVAAP